MKIVSYNLRFGGRSGNHWGKVVQTFAPDIVLAQETFEPSTYFPTGHSFHRDFSTLWGKTSSGWGSAIAVKAKIIKTINVPNFEGWVTGGQVESLDFGDGVKEKLSIFSLHAPTPGPYDRKVNEILDQIKALSDGSQIVLGGDFNVTTAVRQKQEELKNTKKELEILGRLESEFGLTNSWQSINPNSNLPQTLRWSGNKKAPYHCDGIFVPQGWFSHIDSSSIVESEEWSSMSDHNPVVTNLKSLTI